MSYTPDYVADDLFAIDAAQSERMAFIRRTYAHLLGAVLLFVGLEAAILSNEALTLRLLGLMSHSWLLVLGAFLLVSWIASSMARSGASPGVQYLGLGLYAVAEAVIFCPILYIASLQGGAIIPTAGLLTMIIFGGLTLIVFVTKADFSFLRGMLWVGGLAAFGLIIASIFMGFSLGIVFTSAMIVLMGGWILYDTSNVLHHYRTDQHVAASLALFASLATLFWYVLRLVMYVSGRD